MNLIVPLLLLGIGFILRHSAFEEEQHLDVQLIMLVLLGVSLIDLAVVWIFKKRWLANIESRLQSDIEKKMASAVILSPERRGMILALVIYFLCLAPSIYGFVGFLLGGNLSWFVLFLAMTLLGFLLFKPKEEELKRLYADRFEVG